MSAVEIRRYTWIGKPGKRFAGFKHTVESPYFEAIARITSMYPGISKDDLDNPSLFDFESEPIAK